MSTIPPDAVGNGGIRQLIPAPSGLCAQFEGAWEYDPVYRVLRQQRWSERVDGFALYDWLDGSQTVRPFQVVCDGDSREGPYWLDHAARLTHDPCDDPISREPHPAELEKLLRDFAVRLDAVDVTEEAIVRARANHRDGDTFDTVSLARYRAWLADQFDRMQDAVNARGARAA